VKQKGNPKELIYGNKSRDWFHRFTYRCISK